jgi:hypothetical protein
MITMPLSLAPRLAQFTTEDLEANRRGVLSKRQFEIFEDVIGNRMPRYLLVMCLSWLSVQLTSLMRKNAGPPDVILNIGTVVIVLFMLLTFVLWWYLRASVLNNVVESVSGVVEIIPQQYSTEIRIDTMKLVYGAFSNMKIPLKDGKRYRIYYLSKSKHFLSFEEL